MRIIPTILLFIIYEVCWSFSNADEVLEFAPQPQPKTRADSSSFDLAIDPLSVSQDGIQEIRNEARSPKKKEHEDDLEEKSSKSQKPQKDKKEEKPQKDKKEESEESSEPEAKPNKKNPKKGKKEGNGNHDSKSSEEEHHPKHKPKKCRKGKKCHKKHKTTTPHPITKRTRKPEIVVMNNFE